MTAGVSGGSGHDTSEARDGTLEQQQSGRVQTVMTSIKIFPLVIAAALVMPQLSLAASGDCTPPQGTRPFEFTDGENVLRGFIDVPPGAGSHPAIVLIHGSDRTDVFNGSGFYYGTYEKLRETFRSAGFATVVWDKAGQSCSTGAYSPGIPLRQRAHEATAALRALAERPEVDATRMGLWGFSQGGWVAPMAAIQSDDVRFLVLVGGPGRDVPGLTEYQALTKLRAQRVSGAELDAAAAQLRRALAIMRAGGSYEAFSAAIAPLKRYPVLREFGVTEQPADGYRFWQNLIDFQYRADTALSALHQPVLAIFGDRDEAVDWRESVDVYKSAFRRSGNREATIKIFKNADHEMMRVGAPSQPVEGYLPLMREWLAARKRGM
jgi:uncharacterized protein